MNENGMDEIEKLAEIARDSIRKSSFVPADQMAQPTTNPLEGLTGMPGASQMPSMGAIPGMPPGVDVPAVPGIPQMPPAGPTPAQVGAEASVDVDEMNNPTDKRARTVNDLGEQLDRLEQRIDQLLEMLGGGLPQVPSMEQGTAGLPMGQADAGIGAAGPPSINMALGAAGLGPAAGGMPQKLAALAEFARKALEK